VLAPPTKTGISGVVAALAILLLALMTMATIILMTSKMSGFNLGELQAVLEKRRESLAVYLYNVSLCELLAGNIVPHNSPPKWRLVIVNTGPVEVDVDSLVVEKLGMVVLERNSIRLGLGEYWSFHLTGDDYHDAKVYVHTERGSLLTRGYGVPDPYMLVEIDGDGRCTEP